MLLLLSLALLSTVGYCVRFPIQTILDTDIGTDFDDTWALFYILSKPAIFDLLLVQVSTFNTTKRAQIVAEILDSVGRYDVPIAIGKYTGEQRMPQYDPVTAGPALDNFKRKGGKVYPGTGQFQAAMSIATMDNPLLIIEIAPATSLGGILKENPRLSHNCYCYAMSGSIYRGYGNSSTPSKEYNVVTDIPASMAMYDAQWFSPLVTAPVDTSAAMQFFGLPYEMLLLANNSAHVYPQSLLQQYYVWYNGGGKYYSALRPFNIKNGTSTLWDLQAAYMASVSVGMAPPKDPSFKVELLPIMVNREGYTVVSSAAKQKVFAATKFVSEWETNIFDVELDAVGTVLGASKL